MTMHKLSRWKTFRLWIQYIAWPRVLPYELRRPVDNVLAFIARGARPVKKGSLDETHGEIVEDGVNIQFGGACPVQGDGVVDGRDVYYRSRGIGWSFSVAPEGSDDALGPNTWDFEEHKYFWPDGGWVHADVTRECILRAVGAWRKAGRP
jgi:hypothetical protein